MIILGLNIYHGDSAACIFKNGTLVVASEEERFNRIKHSAGFPEEAIKFCLNSLNIKVEDVDYIAINRNPNSRLIQKLLYLIQNNFKINNLFQRLKNFKKIVSLSDILSGIFNFDKKKLKEKIIFFDHHLCHAASSVFASNLSKTDYVTIDGFGDFLSTTTGKFENENFYNLDEVHFPHSLGIFYTAFTQYLGFNKYGDEYKVMGLSSYGDPIYVNKVSEVLQLDDKNLFRLNLDYFQHHTIGVETSWLDKDPNFSQIFSNKFEKLFNLKPRKKEDEIKKIHKDIAASVQYVYEKILFHILKKLNSKTGNNNLCLSGGCAMNSVANGKILKNTPYKQVYIGHSPGDSGGSIGAALLALHKQKKTVEIKSINNPYLGNKYSNKEISDVLKNYEENFIKNNVSVDLFENKKKLLKLIAKEISNKKIIGFFNGRMEFGARALGNRSIIADPRDLDIKNILNLKIKKRESFRPFAPAIMREFVNHWFEYNDDVPYMSKVYKVREDRKNLISAVVHIDGTGRLQTVDKEYNKDFYNLIEEFYSLTGIPILLNTSFNENEPIVRNPCHAIECFLRTNMDYLVMENFLITRK